MKVAATEPLRHEKLLVAAGIVIVGRVEWLMQITNQMEKELERQQLLARTDGRAAELGRELIDLVNYTGSCRSLGGRDARRKRWVAKTC
jgi:hypothetical protein